VTREYRPMDPSRPPCQLARTFMSIADQSVFARISEQTAPETFAAVQASLRQLCAQLEQQADWLHYSSPASLSHYCVRDAYTQAVFYLRHLSLTKPAPPPPAGPDKPAETLADVVREVGDFLQPNPDETPLGRQPEHPPC
jgi:hypothetical protein